MMIFLRYTLSFLIISSTLAASTVLVVGGGPAGLASAIEAQQAGFRTIVVEKRPAYTRLQLLSLTDHSLDLLETWGVHIPQKKAGLIEIKCLEEALEKRIQELGIPKLQGEFIGLENQSAKLLIEGTIHAISYDVIVGADSLHSRTRKELDIPCNHMGIATAALALIYKNLSEDIYLSEEYKTDDLFVRRTQIPEATIVSVQTFSPCRSCAPLKERLAHSAYNCGWFEEAECIRLGACTLFDPIVVSLQQAATFSSEKHSAIIIGDAAASGTFLQGMGANSALKTSRCSGVFFKKLQEHDQNAFEYFNRCMKEITDELIEDSRPLF